MDRGFFGLIFVVVSERVSEWVLSASICTFIGFTQKEVPLLIAPRIPELNLAKKSKVEMDRRERSRFCRNADGISCRLPTPGGRRVLVKELMVVFGQQVVLAETLSFLY